MLVFAQWLISLVWGGGKTVTGIIAAIEKTKVDLANTKVEEEKVQLQNRLETLHAALDDAQNARSAAAGMPWWMAFIADMIGTPLALHIGLIALATTFQPLIVGGWFDWMLHIPPLPKPYDVYEAQLFGYFFGFSAFVVGSSNVATAVVSAIRKRG